MRQDMFNSSYPVSTPDTIDHMTNGMKKKTIRLYSILSISICAIMTISLYQYTNNQLLQSQKHSASERGVEWLMSHKDDMRTGHALWFFMNLYQVTPDKERQKQYESVIREKEIQYERIDRSEIDAHETQYALMSILPQALVLLWKQCLGEDVGMEKEHIRTFISNNRTALFPYHLDMGNKIVGAYVLSELGVLDKIFYDATIQEIISYAPKAQADINFPYLYGLTHIALTKSDYYSFYLNPFEFEKEIVLLRQAVTQLLLAIRNEKSHQNKRTGRLIDISSEVLIALKLLRQKSNIDSEALIKEILSLQNSDGSWSGEDIYLTSHHTLVATLALMDFAQQFPEAKIYCPFGIKQKE